VRVLVAASLLVPLLLFGIASWLNYRQALADATRELQHGSEVAREHAAKVFEGQSQVVDRVNDLVSGMDDAAVRASEQMLHQAFAGIVSRLLHVQSVLLASRDGHPLASAGVYPVPRDVDLTKRDYFRAVIGGYAGTYISGLQVGDVNRQLFFGLARPWVGPDGTLKVSSTWPSRPPTSRISTRSWSRRGATGRKAR
jgi:two-component system NtrC family sensor kinase